MMMADKGKAIDDDFKKVKTTDEPPRGGLSQEESGGPGSREKRSDQRKDGQLEQGKENDLND